VTFERQAENKSLYASLQFASITPVSQPHLSSSIDEISASADSPAKTRSSTTNNPVPSQPEAAAWDDIPDLDTF
jgi:putative transposase